MLRKFAVALVATTLIAGSAFAAEPAATAGAAPTTQVMPAAKTPDKTIKTSEPKTTKTVAHPVKHARKHVARGKAGTMHQAHQSKSAKTHQASVAKAAKHS
jgi:hypothetical protein